MLVFTQFLAVECGVDLDAQWPRFLGCNKNCFQNLELQQMADNVLAAEIAQLTVRWESMLEPTLKKDKISYALVVWAAEFAQRFAHVEF